MRYRGGVGDWLGGGVGDVLGFVDVSYWLLFVGVPWRSVFGPGAIFVSLSVGLGPDGWFLFSVIAEADGGLDGSETGFLSGLCWKCLKNPIDTLGKYEPN